MSHKDYTGLELDRKLQAFKKASSLIGLRIQALHTHTHVTFTHKNTHDTHTHTGGNFCGENI